MCLIMSKRYLLKRLITWSDSLVMIINLRLRNILRIPRLIIRCRWFNSKVRTYLRIKSALSVDNCAQTGYAEHSSYHSNCKVK